MIAAFHGHAEVISLLLRHPQAEVNAKDNEVSTHLFPSNCFDRMQDEMTALMFAASFDCAGAVQALLADDRLLPNLQNKVCSLHSRFIR